MTTSELNADDIETAARALLDTRVATVRELVTARQAAIDARAALTEAERVEAAAYAAAERAGWSGDELHKLGLSGPARRRPGRPSRISNRRIVNSAAVTEPPALAESDNSQGSTAPMA